MSKRWIIGLAVMLAGCTDIYEPAPKVTELGKDQLISHTASLSGTLVLTPTDRRYICAQPAPDAGFSQGESGNLSVAILSSQSESGGESEQTADIEMEGRTPGVLLTRELLYRMCEFGHNYSLDKKEAMTLYQRNLKIIEKIAAIEAGNTEIKIGETLTTTESLSNVGEGAKSATPVPLAPLSAKPAAQSEKQNVSSDADEFEDNDQSCDSDTDPNC